MKKAFLDPSVINQAVEAGISGSAFASVLSAAHLSPTIGLHVVYELARTFLVPSAADKACKLFQFVEQLDPSLSPGSWNLMAQEVVRLRTGAIVLPFLDHLGQASTRLEVGRLARGSFDDRARSFLSGREADVRANLPRTVERYIAQISDARQSNPESVPRMITFEEALQQLGPTVESKLPEMLRGQIDNAMAARLAAHLPELPAIRSTVRANIYYSWVCISQRIAPARDRLDDFREIIEASYCDAFVTSDRKLLKATPLINPSLEAMSGDALFETQPHAG